MGAPPNFKLKSKSQPLYSSIFFSQRRHIYRCTTMTTFSYKTKGLHIERLCIYKCFLSKVVIGLGVSSQVCGFSDEVLFIAKSSHWARRVNLPMRRKITDSILLNCRPHQIKRFWLVDHNSLNLVWYSLYISRLLSSLPEDTLRSAIIPNIHLKRHPIKLTLCLTLPR